MFFRQALIFITLVIFFFPFPSFATESTPPISAPHALIVNLENNETLYEKVADQKTPMASLTKLMVALMILNENKLEEVVTVNQNAANAVGSTAYLETGEQFHIKDLLYGLLIPSGNDASLALAESSAGSEANFVRAMNDKAKELGLFNTHFSNTTGLDNWNHYSTAKDLSRLAQELLNYDLFRQIIQTGSTSLTNLAGKSRALLNTNQLLGNTISGLTVIGLKTGTTPAAGECLMILARDVNGNEVLITLLGSTDRYADGENLLRWVGENFKLSPKEIIPASPIPVNLPTWPFPDMPQDMDYFFETLSELKAAGIIKGDEGTGTLRGSAPLNRAELVTILLRAKDYDTTEKIIACVQGENFTSSDFSDVPQDAWYSASVHCAAHLGWVSGDDLPTEASPGSLPTFRPSDPVKVSEAVKLIVESQYSVPPPWFAGANWYDLYLNDLIAADVIEKKEQMEGYFLTGMNYSLGHADHSISRMASFELLNRLLHSSLDGEGLIDYHTSLSLEEYEAVGANIQIQDGKLYISDSQLGFELSNVPVSNLDISKLRFELQNPSGQKADYFTRLNLLYPENSNEEANEKMEKFFSVIIYDPDYLAAGLQAQTGENLVITPTHILQLSCENHESSEETLFKQICPQGKVSEEITLKEILLK